MVPLTEPLVPRWVLLLAVTLAACGGSRDIEITVSIPGPDSIEAPLANLPLVALPYDRDSIIARLQEAAGPAPHTRALDSLFRAFRGPFIAYAAAALAVQRQQDSLAHLRSRLDSLSRASLEYKSLYRAFVKGSDSLAAFRQRRDLAETALRRARLTLARPIDSLRAAYKRWEDTTYRGYERIVRGLSGHPGREPIADTTGADGRVTLRLGPGRWWIYARSWDPLDPNAEWYWNLPVTGPTLALNGRTGRHRAKY